MFFSVVIPTYNRAHILKDCLEALFQQSVAAEDYEVIVVDDGSVDSTKKLVKSMQKLHKNLVYLYQENQRQGKARNLGVKKAKGKVVVFIGDDIIVTKDFLFEHQRLHYLDMAENAAVLGFIAWHPKLRLNNFMHWMTDGSSVMGKFGGHQFAYEKLRGKAFADYNFFYTSNISLKRSLLEKYPFDPAFTIYGWEDIELGYRLFLREKLRIHYNPRAIAYRDRLVTDEILKTRMVDIGKSAWIIHKKYPELKKIPSFFKGTIFRILGSYPSIFFLAFLNKLSKGQWFHLYYYALSKRYFMKGISQGEKLFR
jgi:glycosyltransferase involved in cell wall biosynthesis